MQQACAGAAVSAVATGTHVPASANNNRSLAVRRCMLCHKCDASIEQRIKERKEYASNGF
jgi:hypothetical protein